MNIKLQKQFQEAAKQYSSDGNYGVTLNDPKKYKAFRDGQDNAYDILTTANLTGTKVFDTPTSVFLAEENKALKERVKELEGFVIRLYDLCKDTEDGDQYNGEINHLLSEAKAALTPINHY